MTDYAKAALELKGRLDAKTKRRVDLYAFFESLKASLIKEVKLANVELAREGAPLVSLQPASEGEPTIEMTCGTSLCRISQDRAVPSVGAVITGESGSKTITFLIDLQELPLKSSRVSLTPEIEEKVEVSAVAAIFVEAVIMGAP
jgi:hypothetical protein